MQTVYMDALLLIDLAADYLLLLGTAKICGVHVLRRRLLLGAALGAAYSAARILLPALGRMPCPLAAAAAMVFAAFGRRRKLLRLSVVFCGMAALLSGAVLALTQLTGRSITEAAQLKIFLPAFALCYGAVTLVYRKTAAPERQTAQLTVELAGKTVELTALIDTGNALTDPLSGRKIIVAEPAELMALFPPHIRQILRQDDPVAAVAALRDAAETRFRLIPYSAVGVREGMLVAFRPTRTVVDGRRADVLIALAPNSISDGTYSALMGVL